jgi:D-alanyl-lipoteichoic acid acyltransferase DltB (MBOAT superfamily)
MSFATVTFFVFCVIVFALYYARASRPWQNWVSVVASYVFYAWWDYRFCSLMLIASVMDYVVGARLYVTREPWRRRALLAVCLTGNLGMLGFFKYYNFFAESLSALGASLGLTLHPSTLQIILPAGISFYTFQTMSYTLDIYRGRFQPVRDLGAYMAFVSFFPQLVAGPIERATHLLPQVCQVRRFDYTRACDGMRLILWGLFKKMVIADNVAAVADQLYGAPAAYSGPALALATFCFGLQIYTDFSAYSDIAAGTANLFGIELIRNFAYPYFAQNVAEFWRRWHISLSTWFRDYVYVPLGGSRISAWRTRFNVMITFLLSGLWHGASWNFVIWGGLNGLGFLPATFRAKRPKVGPETAPAGAGLLPSPAVLLRIAATQAFIFLGWIFFRAKTLPQSWGVLRDILSVKGGAEGWQQAQALVLDHRHMFVIVAVFLGVEWVRRGAWNVLTLSRLSERVAAVALTVAALQLPFWGIRRCAAAGVAGVLLGRALDRWLPARVSARLASPLQWVFLVLFFWLIMFFGTYARGAFIYFQF